MGKSRMIHVGLTLLAIGLPGLSANAENGSDRCDSALLPQIVVSSASMSLRGAWLSLVSEANYEQAKAGGAINLIIQDLPIGASYSQFDEKRKDYFQQEQVEFEKTEARAVFRQSLKASQLEAWTSCMLADVPGVRVVMRNEDVAGATAEVHYQEAPGRKKIFKASVSGGTLAEGTANKFTLDHGGKIGLSLLRGNPSASLKVLVNGKNMTDAAVSVAPTAVPTPPPYADCASVSVLSAGKPASSSEGPAPAVTGPGYWNAGRSVPPSVWVDIDLGSPNRIRFIKLDPEQTPAGYTQHRIYGKRSDGVQVLLGESNAPTIGGGVFTVLVSREVGDGVRSVRVETLSSPSWIAWREIEVFGCK